VKREDNENSSCVVPCSLLLSQVVVRSCSLPARFRPELVVGVIGVTLHSVAITQVGVAVCAPMVS